ncbi:MAG: hypothetical protein AAGE43_06235 [Pseudomonadota bacterium]
MNGNFRIVGRRPCSSFYSRGLTLAGSARSLLTFFTAVLAATASAHPILVPVPTQTMADRVLESDTLLLAREDPQEPFRYAPVGKLKGEIGSKPIDLFMPSQVRRRLASDPELTVLLWRRGRGKSWQTLGFASEDYLQVVQRILSFAGEWTPNETDNLQRLQEFAPLLGHEDVRLHELAYLEIGRATYASIRSVGTGVSMKRVRAMLDNPIFYQWRGLDIMLMGLSESERDHARVLKTIEQKQRLATDLNLAAWATAYLEITGTAGIDQLVEWYFRDERRSRGELNAISRALAGHANEAPELIEPVVAAYRIMLANHPSAAPDIAHDLIAWQRWDLADKLSELRPELTRSDPLGMYKVNLYLRQAAAHSRAK